MAATTTMMRRPGGGKGSSGGEAQRGSCCETTKDAEAIVEGVSRSVLHEEPLNYFNGLREKSWAKHTQNKAAEKKRSTM